MTFLQLCEDCGERFESKRIACKCEYCKLLQESKILITDIAIWE